jgi:hypothetical protein
MTQSEPANLSQVLDRLGEADTDGENENGGNTISIGQMLDQFSSRSYGPVLLLIALIAVGPTGAIPGMSIVTGLLVIAISVQLIIGRDHIWVPDRAKSFEVTQNKICELVERAKPVTSRIDKVMKRRWPVLVEGPALYVIGATCIALALTMFPLALLPFAVAIPGTAIGFFALALTARDGVFAAIGYAVSAGAIYALTYVL